MGDVQAHSLQLELQPQRKQDLPLPCPTVKGCIDDHPAALTIHARLRTAQIDSIEEVEDVGAELN
jgi:hypothetical protein